MPEFTPEQQEAIRYRALDACVVAGPGSGKTTVLVERYRSLVIDRDFKFSEILAITFTEKAAANMKAKIAEQFRYNEVQLRELDQAWIYTIHGFCARLLRENAIAARIDPRFAVLDARESDDLQMECINAALDELTLKRRDEILALIETLQVPRIGPDLKSAYDGIRSAGLTVDTVRAMPSPLTNVASAEEIAARIRANVEAWPWKLTPTQQEHKQELLEFAARLTESDRLPLVERLQFLHKPPISLNRIPREHKAALEAIREEDLKQLLRQTIDVAMSGFRSLVFDALERFDTLYAERKRSRGALDFNDLERHAIQLLRGNETVLNEIRTRFRQIMLDEFQDVNQQQSDLVDLIRGSDTFFAVGDLNQSIYGFRHARPDIFTQYRDRVESAGKHSGQLMTNFRSRAEILKCVETLLNSADGIVPRDLRAGRAFPEKALPSIEVIRALDREEDDEDDDSNREAKWIAHRVMHLREELHFRFRDFAVLCRNGDSMKPILFEFNRAGIPYVCGRRQSYLASREGLDITALLTMLANPRDGVALGTVLRSSLVGVSDEALLRARLMGSSLTSGLNAAAFDTSRLNGFDPEDAEKLEGFLKNLKRWRADSAPLDVRIVRMLSDCGYTWAPGSQAGDNIEAFLHLARTTGADRSLLEFLRELESIEKGLSSESDLSDEDQGNCVQVMTAHAAKGLEFPVTIVAALHQGTRRGTASVSFTPEHGLGMKWRNPFQKKANEYNTLEDSWARANSDAVKRREDEEANRLFYVAMTRAEEHLILSYTVGKRKPQNWAALLDGFFDLAETPPSATALIKARDGFEASVLVTDSDPPLLSSTADAFTTADVEIVPRPAPGARDEAAVNVTSIAVFARCPRKYFLQRYTGWSPRARGDKRDPDDDEPKISAADLGSAVHALLAGKPGPHPAEAVELANVFLHSELGHRAAGSPRSAREWDFIVEIEGAMVRGSIDLWFEADGAIEIVDYKTDAAIRSEDYAPQLALYAIAIEKAFGKRPARAWLHYLRHEVVEEVAVDETALAEARSRVRRLQVAQDELSFELNEGSHCFSCPFHRSMCPAALA